MMKLDILKDLSYNFVLLVHLKLVMLARLLLIITNRLPFE